MSGEMQRAQAMVFKKTGCCSGNKFGVEYTIRASRMSEASCDLVWKEHDRKAIEFKGKGDGTSFYHSTLPIEDWRALQISKGPVKDNTYTITIDGADPAQYYNST